MEANELRLGNWVSDAPSRAIQINIDHFITKELRDSITTGGISPISLTDEWLTRFGFKDNLPWEIERPYDGKFLLDSEGRFLVSDSNYAVIVARNVKYAHQLQNLYFALTGEELTIKNT